MNAKKTSFQEVLVKPNILDTVSHELGLWHEAHPSEEENDQSKEKLRTEAIRVLGTIMETSLTQKQLEIIELYFYRGKTQQDIAEILGISQQVVSRQLFGVVRKGKKIGGAIRKLRKILGESGISFD
jgi:RNA polymerase sigma factor (sigma-70 family)